MGRIRNNPQEGAMKLSIKGMAWTSAVLWAACLFLTGILNLIFPSYGGSILNFAKSIYPGYAAMSGFVGVIVGTIYALVDGLICGAIFAWLYNKLAGTAAPAA
jgi:hypothetical protein